jgi:hypothetical protein
MLVKPDDRLGVYETAFDAETAGVRHFAQFTVGGKGGTTVRLSPPSQVAVDGTLMRIHDGDQADFNIFGTYYPLSASQAVAPARTLFAWTRLDAEVVEAPVPMAAEVTISAPAASTVHRRGTDLVVEVLGTALGYEERYQFKISVGGKVLCAVVSSGRQYVFTSSKLRELPEGTAELRVERLREETVAGGVARSRYASRAVRILLTE